MKAVEKFQILLSIVDGESWEPSDIARLIGSTTDYARKLMSDLRRSCRRGSGIASPKHKNFLHRQNNFSVLKR